MLKNRAISIRSYRGVRVKASEVLFCFLNNYFIIRDLSETEIHKISTWDYFNPKELQK
jgi:hypothetical protein